MHTGFSSRRLAITFIGVTLLLALLSASSYILKALVENELTITLNRLLYLDYERNVPTWFASSLLLLCATLLFLIARIKGELRDQYTPHWYGLSLILLFCSIDEIAMLHEQLIVPLRTTFGFSGMLYFSWVVVGGAVLLVLGLVYLRFVMHLDRRARWQFLLAASVYLGGALGMEVIGGPIWERTNGAGFLSAFLIHVEEVLELCGGVLFLVALNDYMQTSLPPMPAGRPNAHTAPADAHEPAFSR